MYSHKVYVVATTKNIRDVHIEDVYDGEVFTLDSLVAGFKDRLKGNKFQVSVVGDNAYLDLIDSHDELIETYSIISKNVMLHK